MNEPVIIGAGPVGSNTAFRLRELDPVIIESRKVVGLPVHCTGLVSNKLRELTPYPDSIILNRVRGARLFSANKSVTIDAGRVMADVINRAGYDRWMHERAGVRTFFSEKFTGYKSGRVVTSKRSIESPLVIDCSGAKEGLLGVQAVVKLKRDTDFVELHFSDCPGFFAWVVPVSDVVCRVGLAINDKPMDRLRLFLKKVGAGKVLEYNAGLIPMRVRDFVFDNYLLCGDSAGQVKAVSGGGLVTGVMSSNVMCDAVLKSFKSGNYSRNFFVSNYFKPWKRVVGKELSLHQLARRYLNRCDYDELLMFIERNKRLFESKGDMDFLGGLLKSVVKPNNIKFLLKSLLSLW